MHNRSLLLPLFALSLTTGFVISAFAEDPHSTKPATETASQDRSPDQVFEGMRKSFRADKARGTHVRYQFHFKAPQAGDWWIIVNDGTFTMGKGTVEPVDVTISCTGNDWVELSNGTLGGLRAFLTGRLHVSGSQALARKLDEIFP
jgi:putative sterol carrier protein